VVETPAQQAAELKAREPEQFKNLEDGMQFTGEHVVPDQIATDLPKTSCDIHAAYFVIQGQDDVITPAQAAIDYFKCIRAPKKELILVPNAGHFAFMTAPKNSWGSSPLKSAPSLLPAAREGLNIFSHCGPLIGVIWDWRKIAIAPGEDDGCFRLALRYFPISWNEMVLTLRRK
jgi:hypothetical protein